MSIMIFLYYFSEKATQRGNQAPRGWENDKELRSKAYMKKELDSDGEYPDMEGWEEADDEDEESSDEEFENSNQRGKRQAKKSSNQNDLNFEKTFEEYDESAIGYLSDADEEDLQGAIELDGEDLLFNQAIDDFIQDKKDSILAEGVTVKKGTRFLMVVEM
jgi:hypothetical protein